MNAIFINSYLGVVLKLRKAFWDGGGGANFFGFTKAGGQVAFYVIFFKLIFNKYKF